MIATESPAEQRVVLHDVSWDLYEQILAAHANHSAPRFTYGRGELEIVSPLAEHERLKLMLDRLVLAAATELGVQVHGLGSTTFRRRELERGSEPGSCYYVRNFERIKGKNRIELAVDPPPDLVIEVDITSPSVPKLPIYEEFGVPEVWRHDGKEARVLVLIESGYVEVDESRALPGVTVAALNRALDADRWLDDGEWLRRALEWARNLRVQGRIVT